MIALFVIFSITFTFDQVELREALSKDILTNGSEIEHSKTVLLDFTTI